MAKIKFVVIAVNVEVRPKIAPFKDFLLAYGELEKGLLTLLVQEEQLDGETFKDTLNRLREKYIRILKAESVTLRAI